MRQPTGSPSHKSQQGDQFIKDGEKCLRTSLLRWSPDWEGAFVSFEKAAVSYKAAREPYKCMHAHLRAAEAQHQCNLVHGAAKHYEAAALCAREQRLCKETVQYFQKASSLYAMNGSVEKAADVLSQAARSLEDSNPDAAADLLLEVVDLLGNESKRGTGDALKQVIAMLIRHHRIDQAIEMVDREIKFLHAAGEDCKGLQEILRSHLALIVLHLHQNDYIAADKVYNQALSCEGFASSNEGRAAAELLDAYEKNAPDVLQACLSRPVFTFLDGPILRLARNLCLRKDNALTSRSPPDQTVEEGGEEDDHSILL